MPMIRECVVTTLDASNAPHIAPLGLIEEGANWVIAPFRPSTTLHNLETRGLATASFTDDAEIFAGLVTGFRDFPMQPVEGWPAQRLSDALAHAELEVERIEPDEKRPRFICAVRRVVSHRPFLGMNRARAAVLEAAILATRLDRLDQDKISREVAYLRIAVEKTAGDAEKRAWDRLMAKIEA
ncbi:MAG TPA: DUF447 domain-containing protein [Methylocystis sp.]|nr:DUF447 domain-containing protein [Methylocystis sp.]